MNTIRPVAIGWMMLQRENVLGQHGAPAWPWCTAAAAHAQIRGTLVLAYALVASLWILVPADLRAATSDLPTIGAPIRAAQITTPAPQADAAQLTFAEALRLLLGDDHDLGAFYAARAYAPVWTGPDDAPRRAAVLDALADAPAHALPAARYGRAGLLAQLASARSELDRAAAELRLSEAYTAFARDISTGVLDPKKASRGIKRTVIRPLPAALMQGLADAADTAEHLAALAPQHPEYARLLRARAALAGQVVAGGFGAGVPEGPSLRPGDTDPRVAAMRTRLARLGYGFATPVGIDPARYDTELAEVLRAFQRDHGLADDAVAGPRTRAALNLTATQRLHAIEVALERERWMNIDRGARHVWVNLADFTVQLLDEGQVTYDTRSVVGAVRRDKQTPEFSDRMRYLEINPDWTVPEGVVRRDYLPQLQEDPFALGHLQLITQDGAPIARDMVDFSAFTARTFPFMLRQPPGDTNALGRVKFMFPNHYAIYLHDTPEKQLFARERRTYSSGCVRLAKPFELAHVLLARQDEDPEGTFQRALDSGKQMRILLKDPVPVHIEYRTAFFGAQTRLQFRFDVYGRDRAVHAALVGAGLVPVIAGG